MPRESGSRSMSSRGAGSYLYLATEKYFGDVLPSWSAKTTSSTSQWKGERVSGAYRGPLGRAVVSA